MTDITPLLTEMLQQMRDVLSRDDLRAGLPLAAGEGGDVSPLLAEWEGMQSDYQRQRQIIAELDDDIARLQPWGDYPMNRIDRLSAQGMCLQFWKAPLQLLESHPEWEDAYQIERVSIARSEVWFVAVVPVDAEVVLPGAERQEVPPSPLSTLIMLQTRARDAIKQNMVTMGDFALAHYLEVEAALGLHDTLPPATKRGRMKARLHRIFRLHRK